MLRDTVKTALRLGAAAGEALSSEIDRNIKAARAELIRTGVPEQAAESGQALIEDAIVTFCLMKLGNQNLYERYREAWEYQIDCIRKSDMGRINVQ